MGGIADATKQERAYDAIHSGSYELAVNAFLSSAEFLADKKLKIYMKSHDVATEIRRGADGGSYNHCIRSQYFHEAMNKLTRDAGLRAI